MEQERGKRRRALALSVQITVFAFCFLVGFVDLVSNAFPASVEAEDLKSSPEPVIPERIIIPALNIDASVEHVGVNWKGNMAVPTVYERTGWYQRGPGPGAVGNAVIAGHLDNGLGRSGVFARLPEIQKEDRILIIGEGDTLISFRVTRVARVDADHPPEAVFKGGAKAQLVLITCDGAWLPSSKTYDKRLVVYAEPILR